MQHKIGYDYSEILRGRRTKRQLPLIARLSRQVDIVKLQKEIGSLLERREHSPDQGFSTFDPASSEHNYHLKNTSGQSFIRNYDEFYKNYSMVGFQELSDEARLLAERLDYTPADLPPILRLRGMKDTSYEKYHPHYDERNYTKPTQYCAGEVQSVLRSFKSEACRAALVCLGPKQFISPHFDIGPEYITRTMIPIFTNSQAVIGIRKDGGYYEFHMPSDGSIYFINSGYEHYAANHGDQPRFHIRICLNGQEDLDNLIPLEPVRFVSDLDLGAQLSDEVEG